MDENLLVVSDGAVSFGGVLFAAVVEEAGCDGLSDLREVFVLHVGAG